MMQNAQVHTWNVDNGERLVTYSARAERRSAACAESVDDGFIIASCARGGDMKVPHDTRAAIVDLLATSLERGHWRVALRRFLMLRACNLDVPDRYNARCKELV